MSASESTQQQQILLAQKRLQNDFKKLKSDKSNKLINFGFHKGTLFKGSAVILGPPDTPWEGCVICLELEFPQNYPTRPPTVKCTGMKPFHPNFYVDGRICLDILQNNWSSGYDISSILISIQCLLTEPNPNSPANYEAAQLYLHDRASYDLKVHEFAVQCWDHVTDGCYVQLLEPLIE